MYEVELSVFNDSDGLVGYSAGADIEGLGSPSGFGSTEEEAIRGLREEIAYRRRREDNKLPLPEGYPRTVLVEL